MPFTPTANVKLSKQAFGDENWHALLNQNFDVIDLMFSQTVVGNPNTAIAGGPIIARFVGQRIFQPTCCAWWVCTATSGGVTTTWVREEPRGLIKDWSGDPNNVPAGYALADGAILSIDGETVNVPNLKGLFVVGYHNAIADYNTVGNGGGQPNFTVAQANIQQFTANSNPHHHVGGGNYLGPPGPGAGGTGNVVLPDPNTGDTVVQTVIGSASPTAIDNRPPYYVLAKLFRI